MYRSSIVFRYKSNSVRQLLMFDQPNSLQARFIQKCSTRETTKIIDKSRAIQILDRQESKSYIIRTISILAKPPFWYDHPDFLLPKNALHSYKKIHE